MSCARPTNFQLRKQKSLACESLCQQPTAINTRDRRFRLQKQFSVDHGPRSEAIGNSNRSSYGHSSKTNGQVVSNSWGACGNSSSENTSLRIFTAIKNKTQNGSEISDNEYGSGEQKVAMVSDNDTMPNKSSRKKNDEKININIFLAQTVPDLEFGSDSESGMRQMHGKLKRDPTDVKLMTNRVTADTRRSQFRQKSVSMNEVRPRLMRAMSAPIRQNPPSSEAQEKNALAFQPVQNTSKKRLRRKKIVPIEIDPFCLKITQHEQYLQQNKLVSLKPHDERPSTAKSFSSRALKASKPTKPTTAAAAATMIQSRAKSATNGCEIITLVSLLSPGASDSEREDSNGGGGSTNTDNSAEKSDPKTTPSLRKVGKSVSFQDDDDEDSLNEEDPLLIDLPSVLRRASLVPLAAKIKWNRPPTAPPSSIFHPISVNSSSSNMSDNQVALPESGGDESNIGPIPQLGAVHSEPINIVSASTPSLRKSSIDIFDPSTVYPEYVRSIKEKECWLLFCKMANKGIAVTYDTILRGILSPSEFRAMEKNKKEIIERQALFEAAAESDSKN